MRIEFGSGSSMTIQPDYTYGATATLDSQIGELLSISMSVSLVSC